MESRGPSPGKMLTTFMQKDASELTRVYRPKNVGLLDNFNSKIKSILGRNTVRKISRIGLLLLADKISELAWLRISS